jgi:glucose-1-phosphate thymidylyltransferase
MRKGIILSGGMGTRLYPCTEVTSKQLLPVYDKPLVYYPLSTLMMAGIRDIMIINSPNDADAFKKLCGDGSQWGLKISYAIQPEPKGIAECFRIAADWIGKDDVALILGDNIFYGNELINRFNAANWNNSGCTLFAYHVSDPERFGVIELNDSGDPIAILEKPQNPPTNYAVTGLYFYDNNVVEYSYQIQPSARGELEITDINNIYLKNHDVKIEYMNRGIAWIDTGTFESLSEASVFVGSVQRRTGMMIACPEEIAYKNAWITEKQVLEAAEKYKKSDYGKYLSKIVVQNEYISRR